jgi:hypothetical protein
VPRHQRVGHDPVVALRIPAEARQWVTTTAARAGVSSSAVLRDALQRGLPAEAWPTDRGAA